MSGVFNKLRFKKEHKESEARKQLKNELYSFNICSDIGFPYKPTCMTYNNLLSILAIGTKTGHLRLYGKPGVEFTFLHPSRLPVSSIHFSSNKTKFLTICSDDVLYQWSIPSHNTSKNCLLSIGPDISNIRNIKCSCIGENLYVGTGFNSIHTINTETLLELDQKVISKDTLNNCFRESGSLNRLCNITDLQVCKGDNEKLLIGFTNGFALYWDTAASVPIHVYNTLQPIQRMNFLTDCSEFVSSHADGSYSVWSCENTRPTDHATSPYGPFPCKSITQIQIFGPKTDPYIVFVGGMPRSSHGEKHTLTCMTNSNHIVFEMPSKVVSFVIAPEPCDSVEDYVILILCEEEMLAIDLGVEGWPCLTPPYMTCMHRSVVLATALAFNINDAFYSKLKQSTTCDDREWPITGGTIVNSIVESNDVILTGHEDGMVNIWNIRTGSKLLTISIEEFLEGGRQRPHNCKNSETEDEWPPFKKIGEYSSCSNETKMGVHKILLLSNEEMLIIGAEHGQILMLKMLSKEAAPDVDICSMDMISGRTTRHSRFDHLIGEQVTNGVDADHHDDEVVSFQPIRLLQMLPTLPITALSWQPDWKILGIGTLAGYGAYDWLQDKSIFTRSTYTHRITGKPLHSNGSQMSLNKSWRDSIRSFRSRSRRMDRHSMSHRTRDNSLPSNLEINSKPGQSSVLCITFADTYLHSTQNRVATMWIGTNTGLVVAHQLNIGSKDMRPTFPVTCGFTREIQMRSMAPVHLISVMDRNFKNTFASLPSSPLHLSPSASSGSGHQVIICCEDNVKIRTLPALRTTRRCRFSSKVKKAAMALFVSKNDANYSEHGIISITENGQFCLLNLPSLINQFPDTGLLFQIFNYNSTSFEGEGNVVIQRSPSEFLHVSLSTKSPRKSKCIILSD